jgi:hypothetical protein
MLLLHASKLPEALAAKRCESNMRILIYVCAQIKRPAWVADPTGVTLMQRKKEAIQPVRTRVQRQREQGANALWKSGLCGNGTFYFWINYVDWAVGFYSSVYAIPVQNKALCDRVCGCIDVLVTVATRIQHFFVGKNVWFSLYYFEKDCEI